MQFPLYFCNVIYNNKKLYYENLLLQITQSNIKKLHNSLKKINNFCSFISQQNLAITIETPLI